MWSTRTANGHVHATSKVGESNGEANAHVSALCRACVLSHEPGVGQRTKHTHNTITRITSKQASSRPPHQSTR